MTDTHKQGIIRDDTVGYGKPPAAHRFKPGQSGNPAGRPKGRSVTAILRQIVEAHDGELAERLARVLIERALAGDFRAMREVWGRVEGKVPPSRPHTDDEPAEVVVVQVEFPKASDKD